MKNLKDGDKMNGKILYSAILLVLLAMPMTMAQEAPEVELPDPGITPDSFLYFLDLALDNLALALTFDNDAKIEKSLSIAEERLSEARTMALEGKVEAMSKAEGEHGKAMKKIKTQLEDIDDSDSEGELEKELKVENKIQRHTVKVNEVRDELKVKIKIKGEITPEQDALVESVLESLEGQTGEVEIEIKNEKRKTKIKIEAETGDDADEVEIRIKEKAGIKDVFEDGDKVEICHIPPGNPDDKHTIKVGPPAVRAHLKHGDTLGECEGTTTTTDSTTTTTVEEPTTTTTESTTTTTEEEPTTTTTESTTTTTEEEPTTTTTESTTTTTNPA
jgi:hypothetical protein